MCPQAIEQQPTPITPAVAATKIQRAVSAVIRGKDEIVQQLLVALLARGHVLIEDVPGVGKTTLARTLAACLGGTFRRIQFTSDLLPSDVLGVSVFNHELSAFEFKPGPIFANVVLADEINRTAPRTQSALMEVLNEGQVTVDVHTHPMQDPFMVIATQNPVEHFGTYPLPESQMDRFLLRVQIGYPSAEDERRVITERGGFDPLAGVEPVVTTDQIRQMQRLVDQVRVDEALLDYVMNVVDQTRRSPHLALGVSPRGAIAWYRASQAAALIAGRSYCLPDDLKTLARPVLIHRVVVDGGYHATGERTEAEQVIDEILEHTPVPL